MALHSDFTHNDMRPSVHLALHDKTFHKSTQQNDLPNYNSCGSTKYINEPSRTCIY